MNALLAALALALGVAVGYFVPDYGASAVVFCAAFALLAGAVIYRVEGDRSFLLRLFVAGLLIRMVIGTVIHILGLQVFFGADAITYDEQGFTQLLVWKGEVFEDQPLGVGWGMVYVVAAIYWILGRNPLAIQYVNCVIGAATAVIIYLCAQHIFRNNRVARAAAIFVAFYPSLVLWSAQGLKDGPTVFMISIAMLMTLRLGEKLSLKRFLILLGALLSLLSLRFYIFYLVVAAIIGSYIIGMQQLRQQSFARQCLIIAGIVVALASLGLLRTASDQIETYADLERIQRSRLDMVQRAESGFGQDIDVSTPSGALSAIPIGMTYLLFAPFPWQVTNLRQSITLPEMIIWWGSFPLLVLGLWFTIKYRMRQCLPILIFTSMLTLSYSVFQGNVGTAYRQRSQLLVFYFIFVAVGGVLLRERNEDRRREAELVKQAVRAHGRRSSQSI
jgi:4-amino-4-deoxy-L-arabinose transferase-like glycosyltransferase